MNTDYAWYPTALEIALAQIAVLKDIIPIGTADAIFLHGSPCRDLDLDRKLLLLAIKAYQKGEVRRIILNGMPEVEAAKTFCYVGYEGWESTLHIVGRIPKEDILLIPSSSYTSAESKELLLMAKQAGWEKLIISSQPHHQLRCFLQIIKIMEQMDFWPKVYNLTHDGILWGKAMSKPLFGGGTIAGDYTIHIQEEFNRLVKSAQPPPPPDADGKGSYTPHATIPEMLSYLDRRR